MTIIDMSPIVVSPLAKSKPPGQKPKPPSKPLGPFHGEKERRRKVIVERMILGATFAFCALVVFAVWYSDGRVLDAPTHFLEQFAGKDAQSPRDFAQNCRHPKNKNTPYCLEKTAAIEAQWNSMSLNQGGKVNHYTLHEKY